MKGVAKWIARGVGAALLLLLLGLLCERVRGWWSLRNYTRQILTAGERLDISQLEPPSRPQPDQNAFVALLALTNAIRQCRPVLDEAPPLGRVIMPGVLVGTHRLNQWPVGDRTNTWAAWAPKLAAQADILDRIHQALQRPGFDLGVDYRGSFDQDLSSLVRIKDAGRLLGFAAIAELRAGHQTKAHQRLVDLLRLGDLMASERWIITQLVRRAILITAWDVQVAMIAEGGASESQLAEQQAAWRRLAPMHDLILALEMERAMGSRSMRRLVTNPKARAEAFAGINGLHQLTHGDDDEDEVANGFLKRLVTPMQQALWRYVWHEADELRNLRHFTAAITDARTAAVNGLHAVSSAHAHTKNPTSEILFPGSSSASWWERFRFPFSSTDGSVEGSHRPILNFETQIELGITALAVHRYRLSHGDWPQSLRDLSAQDLPSEPRDPVGGGTLTYRRDPNRGFVLYSKGENGKDDGGDASVPQDSRGFVKLSDGNDSVWPRSATAEESEAALFQKRRGRR